MTIQIADQTLQLVAGGGALLEDGTLVVADLHLGKATAFQARGLAIPEGDTAADLDRLAALVKWHQATRLIINGDLFHSPAGVTPEIERLLESFLNEVQIPIQLTLGNHEEKLSRIPFPSALNPVQSTGQAGFHIVHDPKDAPEDALAITAHWHPLAKIADGKRTSLRLPCFLLRGPMLVLPSFGSFTGGQIIDPKKGDRYFVNPAEEVVEVPGELIRG
jgi:DNA ligase-associated metallophosphoesterase